MISVNIQASNGEELRQHLQSMLGALGTASVSADPSKPKREAKAEPVKESAKPVETKADPAKAEAAKAEAAKPVEAKAEPAKAAKTTDTNGVKFEQVSDIIPKLVAAKGKPVAVELLAKFGAKKGSEIKEDRWGAFIAEAQAMLDGDESLAA